MGTLILSGQRWFQEMVMVGWTWHRRERRCKTFRKSFRIPDNVSLDDTVGSFEHGALYVFLPKLRPGELGRVRVSGQAEETGPQEQEPPLPDPLSGGVLRIPETEPTGAEG